LTSWIPHTAVHATEPPSPIFTSRWDWTKLQHIHTLWLGENAVGQGEELGGRQCNHRTEYDSPDISLNDVSFTSMTVHMERSTPRIRMLRVSMFLDSTTVPWTALDASNVYIGTGRSYNIYILWLGEESQNQRNSVDASATTVQNTRSGCFF
jgi:hypothetical protein